MPLGASRFVTLGGEVKPELLSGTNLSGSSLYTIMAEYDNAVGQSVTTGGSLTVNGTDVGDYDYVIIDGDATFNGTNSTFFTNNTDKHALIWVNGNMSIAASTLIPTNRKMSMSIHVGGTFSLNGGNVSMTRRGGNHYNNSSNRNVNATSIQLSTNVSGNANMTGDGGRGHNASSGPAGNGAGGTAFTGGSGGGGTGGGQSGSGQARGGKGGNAVQTYTQAGGGAGNPLGSGNNWGSYGQSGTGGSIFIFAGNVSGSGNLQAIGGHGAFGPGGNSNDPGYGAGGGGSGGGTIKIFRSNNGTFNTNVSGGGGGRQAQNGSNGSVTYYGTPS